MTERKPDADPAAVSLRKRRRHYPDTSANLTAHHARQKANLSVCNCGHDTEDWQKHGRKCPVYKREYMRQWRATNQAKKTTTKTIRKEEETDGS